MKIDWKLLLISILIAFAVWSTFEITVNGQQKTYCEVM